MVFAIMISLLNIVYSMHLRRINAPRHPNKKWSGRRVDYGIHTAFPRQSSGKDGTTPGATTPSSTSWLRKHG
ncbi:MAG: hypothetical protein L0J14_03080, partial [Bifidobacterium crudilactis]|nr:hypothetical protein [Bifidobacterium crudilactis]